MPCAGVISKMRVFLAAAPGTDNSWELCVMKNAIATDLKVTISNSATTGDNTSDSVSFSAGDLISVRFTPTSSPTNTGANSYTVVLTTTDGKSIIIGSTGTSNMVNNAARFVSPFAAGTAGAASVTYGQIQAATAGVLSNLYVSIGAAAGADKSYTFAVGLNGSDGDISVVISGDSQVLNSDTTHTTTIAAGDLVNMHITPTGTPTATTAQWAMVFTPTTAGESWHNYLNFNSIAAGTTYYAPADGGGGLTITSETYFVRMPACTVKNLYPRMRVAPGSGNSVVFTARKNSADQTLTATIVDTATVASDTAHSFSCADGDDLQFSHVVSNPIAQTSSYCNHSWVAYIAPTSTVFTNKQVMLI
jgi:hypothetical protein